MSKKATDHHQKGLRQASKEKYSEAIVAYTRAIEIKPDEAEFFSDRAVAYFHTGQAERSLEDMNTARDLEPEKGYRYSSRAFIKDHIGDLDGAIEDYQVAVKIDPEDAIAQNNLGLLEEKKGYVQESKRRFVTADELADGEKDAIKRGETPDRWKEGAEKNGADQEQHINRKAQQETPVQKPPQKPGWKDIFSEMGRVCRSKQELRDLFSFISRGWRRRSE